MSSILLSNPFVTPAPPVQPAAAGPQTALAITPSQGAAGAGNTGNTGSYSGSGFGSRDGAQTLITQAKRNTPMDRPFEATSRSIVNAQAFEDSPDPFGTNLPNVDMPDPLPTSPFLKRN